MIIVLLTIVAILIGVILFKIFDNDLVDIIGFLLIVIASCFLIGELTIIFIIQNPRYKWKNKNELNNEREALIYRYNNNTQADDARVISEIAEFNSKVENEKYDLNSLWTNWFVCPSYQEIEVINYEDFNRKPIEVLIKETSQN